MSALDGTILSVGSVGAPRSALRQPHTIFENMKKKKPDITWEEAKEMVAKYWESVPVFFEFCQMKQITIRLLYGTWLMKTVRLIAVYLRADSAYTLGAIGMTLYEPEI